MENLNNISINQCAQLKDNMFSAKADHIKLITNTELIEKLEYIAINYVTLVKEAILRIGGKQFSDEEYQKFVEIGEKMSITLIDFVTTDKHNVKDVMTRSISDIVDKAYDKNR